MQNENASVFKFDVGMSVTFMHNGSQMHRNILARENVPTFGNRYYVAAPETAIGTIVVDETEIVTVPVTTPNTFTATGVPYESFEQRHRGERLTFELATQMTAGTYIHNPNDVNRQGEPHRYKVTSVKTWKRQPNRCVVTVHWGIKARDHYTLEAEHFPAYVIGDPRFA